VLGNSDGCGAAEVVSILESPEPEPESTMENPPASCEGNHRHYHHHHSVQPDGSHKITLSTPRDRHTASTGGREAAARTPAQPTTPVLDDKEMPSIPQPPTLHRAPAAPSGSATTDAAPLSLDEGNGMSSRAPTFVVSGGGSEILSPAASK
jgi:hypothetical protein